MNNTLVNSEESDRVDSLLNKSIPSYRQAYSDRTAWLMACLSELAYAEFNPQQELQQKLASIRMQLVTTFDKDGTQAMLVSNNEFIALAFRGTEATSIKDIKTDIKAKTTKCETGGKMHMGFKEAFDKAAVDIQDKVNKDRHQGKPLFITGHSLGGALAAIATKKLRHKNGGIAACYTYGSPRVGNKEWTANIKSPIYRLVNAADFVTILPPSIYRGYMHCGDMRYLSNCPKGQHDNVKLLYSVSLLYRAKMLLMMGLPLTKFLADHSISIYRKKLMVIAERRNKQVGSNC